MVGMTKPFLMLTSRDDGPVLAAECADLPRFSGLTPDQVDVYKRQADEWGWASCWSVVWGPRRREAGARFGCSWQVLGDDESLSGIDESGVVNRLGVGGVDCPPRGVDARVVRIGV